MHLHTKPISELTPADALQYLKEGNFRFVNDLRTQHDLLEQIDQTKNNQTPFAAIVSCMDSRTSVELVFDQGLGAVFSIRNAGNVVTNTVLGSLEYATAVAGSKLILILGHTGCGAIKGAVDGVELGHLTSLLVKIAPAVESAVQNGGTRSSKNADFVASVTERNVARGVDRILAESSVIRSLVEEGKVGIVPAVYDIATGRVRFFEDAAILRPADLEAHLPQIAKVSERGAVV
jgi:carbonic anhydrase